MSKEKEVSLSFSEPNFYCRRGDSPPRRDEPGRGDAGPWRRGPRDSSPPRRDDRPIRRSPERGEGGGGAWRRGGDAGAGRDFGRRSSPPRRDFGRDREEGGRGGDRDGGGAWRRGPDRSPPRGGAGKVSIRMCSLLYFTLLFISPCYSVLSLLIYPSAFCTILVSLSLKIVIFLVSLQTFIGTH